MKIVIRRDSGWSDFFRNYRIMLDGTFAAKVSAGQTVELDAPLGRHTLQARIDWQRTDLIDFTLGDTAVEFVVFILISLPVATLPSSSSQGQATAG